MYSGTGRGKVVLVVIIKDMFNQDKKFIVMLGGIAIILLIIAGGVWWFFFGKNAGEQNTFDSFLPFGFPSSDTPGGFSGDAKKPALLEDGAVQTLPILRQISSAPVAGAIATTTLVSDTSTTTLMRATVVRYMDRATGNTYDTRVDTMRQTRVSNTTIPKVYEALWGNGAETVIARYLKEDNATIETFIGKILANAEEDREGTIRGYFLPNDIFTIAASPDKSKLFYMTKNSAGATGVLAPLNGEKETVLFASPFSEWAAQWTTPENIFLTTKASSYVPGYLYSISAKKAGGLTKILGGVSGLTTLGNGTETKILYSGSTRGGFLLNLYETKTKTGKNISLSTLPEKCAWGKDNVSVFCAVPVIIPRASYPDEWYQGVMSFSDRFWKIDTDTGAAFFLGNPEELGAGAIDAISPFLSDDEHYLFFTNKKDMALWVLEVN